MLDEFEEWGESIETSESEVFVKNKTIVITDPCYVSEADCEDWRKIYEPYIVKNTLYGDWSCNVFKGERKDLDQIMKSWNEFADDWWERSNNPDNTVEEKCKLDKELEDKIAEYTEKYVIGKFCADAGMVAVYDADKLPYEVIADLKSTPYCACFIENYTGPIRYEIEKHTDKDGRKYKIAYITGDGFFSSMFHFY